jgi:superfamily II helicase
MDRKGVRIMKTCKKCLIAKELTEFNKHKASPDGHNPKCRQCVKAKNREALTKPDKKKTDAWINSITFNLTGNDY